MLSIVHHPLPIAMHLAARRCAARRARCLVCRACSAQRDELCAADVTGAASTCPTSPAKILTFPTLALLPYAARRTMATAESAEINVAGGIRKLCASGATRFWINQRAFAKAAGAVDDARDAQGALTASEKFMQAWGRTRGVNRCGVTKEDQGGRGTYPICWEDGTIKAMGRCAYFDVSEECVKGSMATQLALAAKIRELPQPLNAEAIYQCIVASDGALENVFSGTAGRGELRHLIPLFLKAECIELETFLI